MKIAILDNVIETENIYQITDIKHYPPYDFHTDNDNYVSYGFIIKLYNKISLYIGDNSFQKLDKLRNEVIKYWSNNQSNIPKIEFK